MKEYWSNWDYWDPNKEPLKEAKSFKKISICTTCMDRTHDLKKTLQKNIEDNSDYPNIEFLVLNYNSSDDLHAFMTSNEIKYLIKMGIVKYFITRSPKYYSMSHSRNIAFLNATGQIVTNVDADNFTGKGFASYLNKLSEICPEKAFFSKSRRLMHGRVGMYKNEFINIGGYNEDLVGYGFDDVDLMIRAMNSGFKLMYWAGVSEEDFTKRIKTPRHEIGKNMIDANWRRTEKQNQLISLTAINAGRLVANTNKKWGHVEDLVRFKI